tara:strand:+ start:165 stop:596 length:432 start_codon:yes stop_codon:yes gene_type:complete
MNHLQKTSALIIISFFLNIVAFSQNKQINEKDINFKDLKELYYEVNQGYKEYPLNEERKAIYEDRLKRTKYCFSDELADREVQKISSVIVFNKLNPTLKQDLFMEDINDFNPLKYNFSYYKDKDQFFLIDQTNYVIIIKPKSE